MAIFGVYLNTLSRLETDSSRNYSPISLKIKDFSGVSMRPGDRTRLSGGGCSLALARLSKIPDKQKNTGKKYLVSTNLPATVTLIY